MRDSGTNCKEQGSSWKAYSHSGAQESLRSYITRCSLPCSQNPANFPILSQMKPLSIVTLNPLYLQCNIVLGYITL
jgi:hypothetical protein